MRLTQGHNVVVGHTSASDPIVITQHPTTPPPLPSQSLIREGYNNEEIDTCLINRIDVIVC